MTWDIENFLEHLSGNNDEETNDNLVSCLISRDQQYQSSSSVLPSLQVITMEID